MSKKEFPHLSQYLHDARVNAGLTQKDISKKLGYTSPQFISNWERGVSSPPLSVVSQLIKCYGINRDELFEVLLNDSIEKTKVQLKHDFYGT